VVSALTTVLSHVKKCRYNNKISEMNSGGSVATPLEELGPFLILILNRV
jgi:hypothetical protein